ncbi:MAG: SMC-Scp complex subunit ScpB [Sedimentisphaerales bacterium]|nr:SMC-Scp complex subunit ScpB [Sedimentisphaerales bacterium]
MSEKTQQDDYCDQEDQNCPDIEDCPNGSSEAADFTNLEEPTETTDSIEPADPTAMDDSEVTSSDDGPTENAPDSDHEINTHEITTTSVIEAVLFASDEPITPQKLAEIVGTGGVKEIRQHVVELNEKYDRQDCAFCIESIAGGYQMLTRSEYNVWLGKLLKVRSESKLSPAALETLAIISYKQPIMRVDVEAIRGVGCGEMIRQLCEKGLVKIVGRAEELGRPLLYGTTKKFLEVFGLSSLRDLPQAQDLKPPA